MAAKGEPTEADAAAPAEMAQQTGLPQDEQPLHPAVAPEQIQSTGDRPEVVVGFVAPLGTNLKAVVDDFATEFERVGYTINRVKLTGLLQELISAGKFAPTTPVADAPEADRIRSLQQAGNDLRAACGAEAMAMLGLSFIRACRDDQPAENTAFLFTQLKHPGEVHQLRDLFGDRFILVGVTSSRATRLQALADRLAETSGSFQPNDMTPEASDLINNDEKQSRLKLGQDVRDAFPLADVFVDPSEYAESKNAISRFVDLLFSHQFHTPTIDEIGMKLAASIALRSASMGRQVGAAILRSDGSVVAVGANDVPKAGGGVYWCDDPADHRDHVEGFDSSNKLQRMMLTELLGTLREHEYLAGDLKDQALTELVESAISQGTFSGTRAVSLVEFGRTLHAEMNAILDAARHGTELGDCTLFTTTYPCHECTRHIIGVGIMRVVYVEPYPKSLAETLHADAISAEGPENGKVSFEPFIGIAPSRYEQVFTMGDRKDDHTGARLAWSPATAAMVTKDRWGPIVANAIESVRLVKFWDRLEEAVAATAAEPPPEQPAAPVEAGDDHA